MVHSRKKVIDPRRKRVHSTADRNTKEWRSRMKIVKASTDNLQWNKDDSSAKGTVKWNPLKQPAVQDRATGGIWTEGG